MSLGGTLRYLLNHPFNRGQRLAALGRFARWQVVSRVYPHRAHSTPWIDDVRLLVHRGETGLTGNLYSGLHEFEEMAFALHFLRPGDLFVDVGANSGAFTLLACGAAGANGIAIEPVPATFQRLQEQLRWNNLTARVAAWNIGLAEQRSRLRFTSGLDTINHALAPGEQEAGEVIEVSVETLDDVCAQQLPTVIKIDVEGFEAQVLAGGRKTLATPTVAAVIMELNGSGQRYGVRDEDLLDQMRDFGFGMAQYDPLTRMLKSVDRPTIFTGNQLFVRDLEVAQQRCQTARRHQILGREF